MRRKDREMDRAFALEVLDKAEWMTLAMTGEDGTPYCVPVNAVREGDWLYLHSAPEGAKLDLIRKDGRVAFSLAADVRIDREKSSTYYKSVCGTGRAVVVEDPEEKRLALDCLAERYAARCPRPAPDANVRRVAIIRIDILSLTGKRCLPEGVTSPDPV